MYIDKNKIITSISNNILSNQNYLREVKKARTYNPNTLASFTMIYDSEYYLFSKREFDSGREVSYLTDRKFKIEIKIEIEKIIENFLLNNF